MSEHLRPRNDRRSVERAESTTRSGFGHDQPMGTTLHPIAPAPPPVLEAHEAVKSPARLVIAHYLAAHPGTRMGELQAAIGGERHALQGHLTAMERVGLVQFHTPGGEGGNPRRREYSLDRARWTELLIRLINYPPSDQY